jgi:manganese/zinc/iron transport system ATP- binding protein
MRGEDYGMVAEGLTVCYDRGPVLWDVSLALPTGVAAAIIGPNGAGKSTLLKSAVGLLKPIAGQVRLGRPDRTAYVPQREAIDWDFPITAREAVAMGRYGRLGLFGRLRKSDWEAADSALARLGMAPFADRQIGELSGGQQQRLFIARALLQDPLIYAMDEPFAGVDKTTEGVIVSLLHQERSVGKTVIAVHHDLNTVSAYFDWAVLLNHRLVAAGPIGQVLTRDNLAKTFGGRSQLLDEAALLAAQSVSGVR